MLCKEKVSADGRKGVSVIAACGIFVKDILDNVPIDKYFELFKPNAGGEGGFIRIGIDFRTKEDANGASQPAATGEPRMARAADGSAAVTTACVPQSKLRMERCTPKVCFAPCLAGAYALCG
jgi:hypothetical protein